MSNTKINQETPSTQCCGTCQWHDVDGLYKYYGEKEMEGMGNFGFCRRYPPIPGQWRKNALGPNDLSSDINLFGDYPETGGDEFCGEWKVRDLTLNSGDIAKRREKWA